MGNTWAYELVFQKTQQFTPELFRRILALVGSHSYTLRYPTDVIGSDGMPPGLEFHDSEALTVYMCSHGGCFVVWRDEDDIQLCYLPSDRSFSLGVGYNLRPERDTEIAHDLLTVFSTVCDKLQARYGYSRDEWGTEWALTAAFPDDDYFTARKSLRTVSPKMLHRCCCSGLITLICLTLRASVSGDLRTCTPIRL
jgi:hypothetical protein